VNSRGTALGSLPNPPTRFIGRQGTIAALCERLVDGRLITIVGPGGCGKTRLAVEVGRRARPLFRDGAFFVDLSGITDPSLVAGTVSEGLGLPQPPEGTSAAVLAGQLAERKLLLVIDNCEHLADSCAELAEALVSGCPRLRVLATSRELLGVAGEALLSIGGLELPDRAGQECEGWLRDSEAGALFVDRARQARADFSIREGDASVIAAICERLDGIPLALELAAARTRMMSIQAIAEGLSDRFRLLMGNVRSSPARQRTLLSSIEWSWGLLQDEERCVLRRLAVFASGFTLAAAETVCGGGDIERGQVLGLLSALVDKSLVQADATVDRFRLHETIRAYSAGALEVAGEVARARDRHLDYFSGLAKTFGSNVYTHEMVSTVQVFQTELDNFRTALDWSVESKQFDAGAEVLTALGTLFNAALALRHEALERCEKFLAAELEPLSSASLMYWGACYAFYSEPSRSLSLALKLTELGRAVGDDFFVTCGLETLARFQMLAAPDECVRTVDEFLPLALRAQSTDSRDLPGGNVADEALAVFLAGLIYKSTALTKIGRPIEALAASDLAVRRATEHDWLWGAAWARVPAASAALSAGDMSRAMADAKTVWQTGDILSDALFKMWAEMTIGSVYMYRGDPHAADALGRARAIAESCFDRVNLSEVKGLQGQLQVRLGELDEGYQMLREATSEGQSLAQYPDAQWVALLAEVATWRGDYVGARSHLDALAAQRSTWPVPAAEMRASARLARHEGDPLESLRLACNGLEAATQAGALLDAVELLELAAMSSADLGRPVEAARLLGAAEAERETIGCIRAVPAEKEFAPVRTAIETALGLAAFQHAISEGRSLRVTEAVGYARRGRGIRARPVFGWASLTPAEREVALLVGERLSNQEIAARLFISTVTVKSHLTRIFAKLGVSNRRQLAVVAANNGREPRSLPV